MVMVVPTPHALVGVKVYLVVLADDVLIVDGLHVPLTPLGDVVGREAVAPVHSGPIWAKFGVSELLTTIVICAPAPHVLVGVKVYTVVLADDVLIVDGLHVPLTPLGDVVGREAVAPVHSGPIWAKFGVSELLTTIVICAPAPHVLVGVKVYTVVLADDVLIVDGLH